MKKHQEQRRRILKKMVYKTPVLFTLGSMYSTVLYAASNGYGNGGNSGGYGNGGNSGGYGNGGNSGGYGGNSGFGKNSGGFGNGGSLFGKRVSPRKQLKF
jgi:hypothetical protein